MFSYPFVIRAFIVGVFVSLCAALLGVILVLKRYSLIGHGLADVGFASISLALAIGVSPILFSIPVIIITSFIIMYISQNKKINGDVSIGIFSTSALSIGVLLTSLTRGFNIDVYNYMFGSILAMNQGDLIFSVVLSLIVIVLFIIFYNRLFIITLDEQFARSSGINVTLYQFLISFLTALTVVLGMRMMGTLLISSLIIFPAIIARRIVSSFKSLIVVAAVVSIICFCLGMVMSFVLNTPTGATVVIINVIVLIIVSMLGRFIKKQK